MSVRVYLRNYHLCPVFVSAYRITERVARVLTLNVIESFGNITSTPPLGPVIWTKNAVQTVDSDGYADEYESIKRRLSKQLN